MQISKINSQSQVMSNNKNKSTNKQLNSQPAFGIKFIVKPEAADSFLTKAKAFSAADTQKSHYLSTLILEEPIEFLQKLTREIIAHNKTSNNHLVYGETRYIENFDITYPRNVIDSNEQFSKVKTPKNIKNISLLNSTDPENIYKKLGGDINFDYHVTLDDGSEIVFPSSEYTRSNIYNNPNAHNTAGNMQRILIKDKNTTQKKVQEDLNFLIAKTAETGK